MNMKSITNGKKFKSIVALLLMVCLLLSACGSKKCALCGKSFSGSGHSTTVGTVCDNCYNSSSGLSGGSSGSNTGAWIAVTVMVFVAVFAATSGVVYLVLQKVLPQEKPAPHAARRQEPAPVYRAPQRPATAQRPAAQQSQPVRQSAQPSQRNAYTQEWVCTRDHSRNYGPYCTLCGAPRPTQQPQRTQQMRQNVTQNGNAYYAAAPRQQTQPVQQPRQPVQSQQPAQPRYVPEAPEAAPTYSGKFARKSQPETEPIVDPLALADDAEIDADLLAAIFREAEQGTEEQ